MKARRLAIIALGAVAMGSDCGHAENPPAGTPVAFAALPGFAEDDHAAALRTFRVSCAPIVAAAPALRTARPAPPALVAACRAALALDVSASEGEARRFFEDHFTPLRLAGGFLTGYYEPVVEGSLTPTATFKAPLRARPADGTPLPDRDAIEAGALGPLAPPLVYVRDPVEAFFIHVQGSARIHLPDGSLRRLVYAGRNGQPYTSIGKVLVETLGIPPAEMGLTQVKGWIRANGQEPGEAGAALMARNRSYIFFAFDDTLGPGDGPVGGAGVSLTPLRSLAIDRHVWPYGLPVFIDSTLPWQGEEPTAFRRLLVAQDTGSAILGAARGDIFFGSGAEAALRAGPIRHPGTVFVLWPKDRADAEGAE